MKKKAIKIAASTAIAASAFVAPAAAQKADAATNVDQLLKDAEQAAGALKWAISAEFTADGKTAPHDLYNLTKDAAAKAKAAVAKLSGKEKVLAETRLVDVDLQISRTQAYIDSITASEKVQAKTAALNAAVSAKDLDKVEELHHATTAEVRKQAEILYRVYGKSTRELVLSQTKVPAEAAVKATQIDVTVKMHLDAADASIKAGKLDKASESVAKANAWLDQTSATFKAELTASRDDIVAALPLAVTSVTRVNDTTVTVALSKNAGSLLSADDFTFENGLEVVSHSVSADGKTVTLTTGSQEYGATYALLFKGAATGLSFSKGTAPNDGTVTKDPTKEARLDAGQTRVYTVDLKHANGSKYTGEVTIDLRNENGTANAFITAVEGKYVDGEHTTWTGDVGIDGKLSFTVTHTGDETDVVEPLVEFGSKDIELAPTYFYVNSEDKRIPNFLIDVEIDDEFVSNFYHSKEDNYFVLHQGLDIANALKYSYDDNDKFYIEDRQVSLSTFESALSAGDWLNLDYKETKGNVSTFHITKDVTNDVALSITNPANDGDIGFRYDGDNFRLTGKGHAGHKVQVFKDINDNGRYDLGETLVGEATISSNGTWVVQAATLSQNDQNDFVVVQYAPNKSAKDYAGFGFGTNHANVEAVFPILEGAFALTASYMYDDGDEVVGLHDQLFFGFVNNSSDPANDNDYRHVLELSDNARITLVDANGKKAVINVSENEDATNTIIFDSFVSRDNGFGTGTITITDVSGFYNQDNQSLNLSASRSVKVTK